MASNDWEVGIVTIVASLTYLHPSLPHTPPVVQKVASMLHHLFYGLWKIFKALLTSVYICLILLSMTKCNEREDLKVLYALVKQYEEPGLPALALEKLKVLARVMQIADAQGNTLDRADEIIAERVAALAESMRPHLEAVIGPTIGGLKRKAVAEIQEEFETHQKRKEIIDDAESGNESLEAVYNELLAGGWETHLSLDRWLEDERERELASAAEGFLIGKLKHELEIVETLFQRFVSQAGTLSKSN